MNLVTRFHDLKIVHKLALVLGILLIGFLFLTFAYYVVVAEEQAAWKKAEQTNEFVRFASRVESGMLQARRREKDFLLRDDAKYLDQHAGIVADIKKDIAILHELAPGDKERRLISDIQKNIQAYDETFIEMAESKRALGLDESSGLHGEMRQSVHAIEALINKYKDPLLGQSMLMMRRHEKDFIQRGSEKYINKMAKQITIFEDVLKASKLSQGVKKNIRGKIADYHNSFLAYTAGSKQVKNGIAILREAVHKAEAALSQMLQTRDKAHAESLTEQQAQQAQRDKISYMFYGALALISMIVTTALYFIGQGILHPMKQLHDTVSKVSEGDFSARATLTSKDELGQLGAAFDNLLDDRVARLAEAQRESERLNNSIIELIRAVATISQKDFSVKVPVSEDVTGAVADSLNLLTQEISEILNDIRKFSQTVATVSGKVNQQSDNVISVADAERLQVETSAKELDNSLKTMHRIAQDAQAANEKADRAIENTETALASVTQTVEGINSIRDTIGEAEKRIKRLGERSQEITGIVNLINSIAERTHILALNASMHAASAGEAGRGFAVVADEVQRLAENARKATSEISTLVNNIRVETVDTMTTMNTVISQVSEGTRKAEQAGDTMRQTQRATSELVDSVQQIAESSQSQAQASNKLRDRALEIKESTHKTARHLQEQKKFTNNLVKLSQLLVRSVSVFKLSQSERTPGSDLETDPLTLKQAILEESSSPIREAV